MTDKHRLLQQYINAHPNEISHVVDFDGNSDRLLHLDFTAHNQLLQQIDLTNTTEFSTWVENELLQSGCRYGIGGYMEHRTLYARSSLFSNNENTGSADEPRRLHLGVDIWGPAKTPVYAPMDGIVHSFADNDHFGDYGPTIIVQHDLDGLQLFSLYGHLDRQSLTGLFEGKLVKSGEMIARFGNADENGNWPPHLHFQLMFDIGNCQGDYPGVGRFSEKQSLMQNIPDPNLILQFSGATII